MSIELAFAHKTRASCGLPGSIGDLRLTSPISGPPPPPPKKKGNCHYHVMPVNASLVACFTFRRLAVLYLRSPVNAAILATDRHEPDPDQYR